MKYIQVQQIPLMRQRGGSIKQKTFSITMPEKKEAEKSAIETDYIFRTKTITAEIPGNFNSLNLSRLRFIKQS